jgi:hypothetical protein
MLEREAWQYQATFDSMLRAGVDAGFAEAVARKWVFRGFAYAAAGEPEPPAKLLEEPDP